MLRLQFEDSTMLRLQFGEEERRKIRAWLGFKTK